MSNMQDYVKSQTLENIVVEELVEKLEYLLFIRNEMERDLDEVNGMVKEITQQLKDCGIET